MRKRKCDIEAALTKKSKKKSEKSETEKSKWL